MRSSRVTAQKIELSFVQDGSNKSGTSIQKLQKTIMEDLLFSGTCTLITKIWALNVTCVLKNKGSGTNQ